MHRSGSPRLARLLNTLGVDFGPPELRDRSPGGHSTTVWEHRDLVRINDAILSRFGGVWHDPPLFPDGWWDRPDLDDLRANATAVIARDFETSRLWGWTDPRVCLTLPFWQRLLPGLSYVCCVRNPLDVCAALQRDGLSFERASELWLAYTAASFAGSAGAHQLVVCYEDLVDSAHETMERCARFLDVTVSRSARAALEAFVDEDPIPHRSSFDDAVAAQALTLATRTFYAMVVGARRAETVPPATEGGVAAEELIEQLQRRTADLEIAVTAARNHLSEVTASRTYRLAQRLLRVRQRIAPAETLRGRVLRRGIDLFRALRRRGLMRARRPEFSLLLDADGALARDVLATASSVLRQSHARWQLIVSGVTMEASAALPVDPRILIAPPVRGDAAGRLNAALSIAPGTFVAVLGAGDELSATALQRVRRAMSGRRVDILYSDEESTHAVGSPAAVVAKPDWSPELLLAFPYAGRFCVFRRAVVRALGGWRSATIAAEEYDLILAAARGGYGIRRVAETLYRRREPLAVVVTSPAALDARRIALETHFAATGSPASVDRIDGHARLRVRWPIGAAPLVSIVIATRDRLELLRQCIDSIESRTTYRPYQILIVDNDSVEPETLRYFETCPYRVVRSPGAFNFSRINNAGAHAAEGEYLLFLNNDTEVIAEDWIGAMLEWAQQPEIGCVGAKLLFGDGRVQHAGVTLHDGSAFHNGYGERVGSTNWIDIELVRNFSAVTAACLMIRREVFLSAGGFDESFPVAYNDIEFCVRLRRRGYRHLYTPYATLYHHESSSRTPGVARGEGEHLRSAIGRLLWHDPYCPRTQQLATNRLLGHTRGVRALNRVARVSTRGVQLLRGSVWRAQSCRSLQIVPDDEGHRGESIRWIDRAEIRGASRIGLFMHPVASRTFIVNVPQGGRFHAWIALLPEVWDKNNGGATFRISVAVQGETAQSLERTINPRFIHRHRRWIPLTMSLASFAGVRVELTLSTRLPPGAGPANAWAVWGDPTVLERRSLAGVAARQARLVKDVGLKGALVHYTRMLAGRGVDVVYDGWVREQLRAACDTAKAAGASLAARPRISIITPVYNTDPRWLRRCVASVRAQLYPEWQLCLSDDGSSRAETRATLDEIETLDERITVVRNATNGGISAASNAALALATGQFVALLDHDDELAPNALLEVVKVLNAHADADVVYTDEDKLEMDGTHVEPFFKPDWSPEYLRSCMYVGHLTVYRRAIVDQAGRFRSEFDGSQDYDLALRVTERTSRIHHVPRILYHWRKIPGSAAGQVDAKPWGLNAARRALTDHVSRLPIPATVEEEPGNGLWRVKYTIVGKPLVSIVIPTDGRVARIGSSTRDLPLCCIRSIVERTTYRHYELVIVDNGRLSPELLQYLRTVPHRRVEYEPTTPFNFAAKINFAARHARGDHLLFLNDDTEVISEEWLTAMLEFSQQPEIGAVGGKLFYPDGRLQHVGVVLGIGGGACHVFAGQPANSPGYFGSALVIRNYSAVTGACCMTRRDVFDKVGGFDEQFATDFNDVDYCLRVRASGHRIVATPFAQLYHYEGATFGSREHVVNPGEVSALSARWAPVIAADPFYNLNLSRSTLDYTLRLDGAHL